MITYLLQFLDVHNLQLIYSNASGLIEQGQYIFDMLWNMAIPYAQKLTQIEYDDKVKYETAPLHYINADGTIALVVSRKQ